MGESFKMFAMLVGLVLLIDETWEGAENGGTAGACECWLPELGVWDG